MKEYINLHCHTRNIVSGDYEKQRNRELESSDIFWNIVNEKRISMIAITNHNYFDIQQYKNLVNKDPKVNEDITTILPGVEFNVEFNGEKFHLIIICSNLLCDEFYEFIKHIRINIFHANEKPSDFKKKEDDRLIYNAWHDNSLKEDKYSLSLEDLFTTLNEFQIKNNKKLNNLIFSAHYFKDKDVDLSQRNSLDKIFKEKGYELILETNNERRSQIEGMINKTKIYCAPDNKDWDISSFDANKMGWNKYGVLDYNSLYKAIKYTGVGYIFNSLDQCLELDFNDEKNKKINIMDFSSNVIFGKRGSGKTYILDKVAEYYKEKGGREVKYYKQSNLLESTQENQPWNFTNIEYSNFIKNISNWIKLADTFFKDHKESEIEIEESLKFYEDGGHDFDLTLLVNFYNNNEVLNKIKESFWEGMLSINEPQKDFYSNFNINSNSSLDNVFKLFKANLDSSNYKLFIKLSQIMLEEFKNNSMNEFSQLSIFKFLNLCKSELIGTITSYSVTDSQKFKEYVKNSIKHLLNIFWNICIKFKFFKEFIYHAKIQKLKFEVRDYHITNKNNELLSRYINNKNKKNSFSKLGEIDENVTLYNDILVAFNSRSDHEFFKLSDTLKYWKKDKYNKKELKVRDLFCDVLKCCKVKYDEIYNIQLEEGQNKLVNNYLTCFPCYSILKGECFILHYPSPGQKKYLELQSFFSQNDENLVYILDEPEANLDSSTVIDLLKKKFENIINNEKRATLIYSSLNSNLNTIVFPRNVLFTLWEKDEYLVYQGNIISNKLFLTYDNDKLWVDTAMIYLEGGKDSLSKRLELYNDKLNDEYI